MISLDAGKGLGGRALFLASDMNRLSVTAPVRKGAKWCQWYAALTSIGHPFVSSQRVLKRYDFYVKNGIRDKLNPIKIQANYSLVDRGGRRSSELTPALDQHVPGAIENQVGSFPSLSKTRPSIRERLCGVRVWE